MTTDTRQDVPIAVVGMSCLFPKAGSLKGYWRVLRLGLDCIDEVPESHWAADKWFDPDPKSPDRTYCRRGGFLDPVSFDPTEFQMPPNAIEATDTSQILGLVVAKAALEDAGYGEGRVFDREKTSVILGVTGCLELVIPLGARLGHPIWRQALAESGVRADVAEEVVKRISSAYVPWQENSFPGLLGNVVAGRIANRLDLHGTNCVVDAACASSNSAAHLASLELATGRADMVVTGGVDTFNDIFMYMCFSKTPALSPSGDCRPFSGEGDGTLLGEGIGVVVLKRLSDAERDGDRIYAVIRGVGTSSDGEGQAIYAPSSDGQKRCLERAYEAAGVDPATIGLIEAHGTGTRVGDVVEFEALRAVFSGHREGTGWCALGSVKSQIGHTKAAAGAAGLIKASLALHHKVLPPTLKSESPNPKLRIDESPFYLSSRARPWVSEPGHPRRAGLSAFGFGGSNFHIVLEEHGARRTTPAWDGSVEIVALSAETRGLLAEALERFEQAAAAGPEAAARCAWESRQAFVSGHPHRLVFVVDGDAVEAAARARAVLEGTGKASDVYLGEGAVPGKVAFLFPGQGSQYVEMGRDLACIFPEMLEALEAADAAVPREERLSAVIFPPPALTEEGRAEQAARLTRTDFTQPALGAVETGMLEVLRGFGLQADFACGHSYGELVALHAAARLERDALHRLSYARGAAMACLDGDRGTMIAVTAPLAEVEALVAERGLEVTLANRNAPRQAILSGGRAAIEAAAAACKEKGWTVQPLKVAAAFHSPLVAAARDPFRAALQGVSLAPGEFPVFANHGARPYPQDEAESRDLLADQLVSAVDFVGVVENLYEAGARVFVEVGPRATLTGLVRSILGARPHVRCAVDGSAGRGSGLVDLARALAQCAAAGVTVDLGAWETVPAPVRKKKMEVRLVGANYRSPGNGRTESVPRPPNGQGAVVSAAPPVSGNGTAAHAPAVEPPGVVAPPVKAAVPVVAAPPTPSAPPPVASSGVLADAFRSVQSNIAALQALQQQTAQAHQRFLEGQELAQRTFQQVLEGQQRLVDRMLGGGVAPAALAAPVHAPAPPVAYPTAPPLAYAPAPPLAYAPAPPPVAVTPAPPVAPVAVPVPAAPVAAAPAAAPPPAPVAVAAGPSAAHLESVLLALVADKTGYPVEMLHLDMDLESDLGIDSIKRVEILAGMEERAPEAGRIETDKMGSLRTLRQVIDLLATHAPAAPAAVASIPANGTASASAAGNGAASALAERAADLLLEVIADKTGYPRDMLGLDMDLESDLGIDSIKRVEILAAMEERLPEAGRVETDRMGSLRTLRQVLEALVPAAPAAAPVAAAPAAVATAQFASPPAAPKNGNGARPLQRQVLRAVEAAPPAAAPLTLPANHELRVVDDGCGVAPAIVERVRGLGLAARLVSLDEAAEAAGMPCGGLVIVAPVRTSTGVVDAEAVRFLERAFHVTSRLAAQLRGTRGSVFATVTRLDGAFGLRGADFEPVLGGLTGLPKTAVHEWDNVRCRAIDVAADWTDAAAVAAAVVAELAVASPLEVGLAPGRRVVLEAQVAVAHPTERPLQAGDVVVISGGARGVTAEAAVALAREWHPTLVLLGRSPVPTVEPAWMVGVQAEGELKKAILAHHFNGGPRPGPADLERVYRDYLANREVSNTLARLRDIGVEARYVSVDVRDAAAVARALDDVRAQHGPVRGLVHAAGVLADKRIEDKTPEQFASVLETKLDGLRNLLASCPPDELRVLALFSSMTARFGRPGQVDYCMANEAFNKIAQVMARQLPSCKVVSMNWGPWDGGMVNDGLRREFARLGVGLIPLQSGARALVAELGEAGRDVEILIGDGFPQPDKGDDLPLALETVVSVDRLPFLDSHRLAGRAVLPMAMVVEWMAHAGMHAQAGLRFVGVDEVSVLKGVTLEGGEAVTLRFHVSAPRPAGDHGVELDVEMRSEAGVHARGKVRLAPQLPAAPALTPAEGLAAEPHPVDVATLYDAQLFHGPHFHAVRAIQGTTPHGMIADLAPAPRPGKWMAEPLRSDWIADPLVLDGGLQMGLAWCFAQIGAPSLPTRAARFRQYVARFPKKGVTAWLEVRSQTSRSFSGDLTFADPSGKVVARFEGVEWAADPSLTAAFEQGRPQKTHR